MTQVEVITSVQRRRSWSAAEKQEIVAASARPGGTVSDVARRFGISPQQLFTWRRQFLAAATGVTGDGFLPIALSEAAAAASSLASAAVPKEDDRIEIVLPDGVVIRVGLKVASEALRRVLAALR